MTAKKIMLTIAGFACLGLGGLGVVVPLLPTTPLVLLAAGCFSASNARAHAWLSRSRVFGPYIEHYRTKRGIPLWLKLSSIAFLWAGLLSTMLVAQVLWMYILLGCVGVGVTVHIALIRARKKPPECD